MENEIVGCCGVFPTKNLPTGYVELVKFYLDKKARGTGIGRALMDKTIDSAKAMGYSFLYLECFPEFVIALKLYEKYGFIKIEHPLGQSGHSGCSIWMVKEL